MSEDFHAMTSKKLLVHIANRLEAHDETSRKAMDEIRDFRSEFHDHKHGKDGQHVEINRKLKTIEIDKKVIIALVLGILLGTGEGPLKVLAVLLK